MLTPVRRRLAVLAMVLLVPSLGACGFGYQTDQVYQPSVGVNNRSGQVDILGAVVVSTSNGRGTFVASLVNKSLTGSDTLTTMTGPEVQAQVSPPVEVPADTLVNLADKGAVGVTGDSVRPGKFVRLTLQFQSGQKTEVNVPVVPFEAEYSSITPAGVGGSSSPSGSPSSSPSGSPSSSPSP